jgi:hypothetical protein
MIVAYWIVAGLLAAVYLYGGVTKLVQSPEKLAPMAPWAQSIPLPRVRLIGLAEVLGAAGLIVPPLVRIAPWLALAAAIGLVLLQAVALAFHLARGERSVGINVALLIAAVATVWLATTWLA